MPRSFKNPLFLKTLEAIKRVPCLGVLKTLFFFKTLEAIKRVPCLGVLKTLLFLKPSKPSRGFRASETMTLPPLNRKADAHLDPIHVALAALSALAHVLP